MFHFDEEKHIYTLDDVELDSVTGILTAEGFIDTRFYDEWSRTRGSYVHEATHLYDRGELDEDALDPQLRPYLDAWIRFKEEARFRVLRSEEPVFHPILFYAGTPDKTGFFDEKLVAIIDIKSGKAESWAAVQTAGYAGILEARNKARFKRFALELREDATYKLIPHEDRQDTAIWLSALAVHNWKKNNLRR